MFLQRKRRQILPRSKLTNSTDQLRVSERQHKTCKQEIRSKGWGNIYVQYIWPFRTLPYFLHEMTAVLHQCYKRWGGLLYKAKETKVSGHKGRKREMD